MTTVELFAGPGGFSLGAQRAGVTDLVGFEKDPDACATAEAAGHKRILCDVSMVDVREWAHAEGEIGSPPCQSYSSAGKQKGKLDRPRIEAHVQRVRKAGRWLHYSREGWHDDRSPLVLEPLRWALGILPEWVALEQVPAVLPLWQAIADVLRDHGYHVDTGVLSAEQYGVPQTRKRAFLIAARCEWDDATFCAPGMPCGGKVSLPAPTHRKYRKGVAQAEGDPALLPWVSMAQALGWGLGARPSPTITGGGTDTGGAEPITHLARYTGDPGWSQHVPRSPAFGDRPGRELDEPSFTITGSGAGGGGAHHAPEWRPAQLRQSAQARATIRTEDEPAPTITAGHDRAERVGEPAETVAENDWEPTGMAQAGRTSEMVDPRPLDAPAGTITGKATAAWVDERPDEGAVVSTGNNQYTLGPGQRGEAGERDWRAMSKPYERSVEDPAPVVDGKAAGAGAVHAPGDRRAAISEKRAVRVSVQEAAVLQTFPPDYPWQGSKTAQYRQVGDAVPPLLAEQVVDAVLTGRTI